jgi:hypothetical protein
MHLIALIVLVGWVVATTEIVVRPDHRSSLPSSMLVTLGSVALALLVLFD